ncbi:MAG: 30S ribosomal protein S16 [candidate division Zixibacteria bacterium RBG_16_48_11]|nr:MAG: 30S ribosomal protein S16 [candidate division Zixibacteria bacterium RBG_16_48_11]
MSVKLRLHRMGSKKRPYYRIVATDSRNRRDGRFIEIVGQYHPISKPPVFDVNQERIFYWLKTGSQPSQTVSSLLKQTGVWNKWLKLKKGEAVSELEVKKEVRQTSRKKSKKRQAKPEQTTEAKA